MATEEMMEKKKENLLKIAAFVNYSPKQWKEIKNETDFGDPVLKRYLDELITSHTIQKIIYKNRVCYISHSITDSELKEHMKKTKQKADSARKLGLFSKGMNETDIRKFILANEDKLVLSSDKKRLEELKKGNVLTVYDLHLFFSMLSTILRANSQVTIKLKINQDTTTKTKSYS